MLKRVNQYLLASGKLKENEEIFGENMEGVHSIEYSNLESPFYIFAIRRNGIWLSWEKVEKRAKELGLPTVPVLFKGVVQSLEELKNLLREESYLGGEREGVVRNVNSFEDLSLNIGKVVRQGHVQTDEHWSRNWEKADISKDFWTHICFC